MKKNLLVVFILLVGVLFFGSYAMAIPFEVEGVGIDFGGIGIGSPVVTPTTGVKFDLDDGESTNHIDLFTISFNDFSAGIGDIHATVDVIKPDLDVGTQNGFYAGFSFWGYITGGFIDWGNPVNWEYDLGDVVGTLTLDLDDIDLSFLCGNSFTVSGVFSNEKSPAPVPEPASMVLLGTGLIMFGMVSKRKFIKKVV